MKETTLARQLQPAAVDSEVVDRRYHPMLMLVKELLGVVPNCIPLLEIWPPGLRSYNLLVPNLLNLPFSLWGIGAPKALIGLSMYASSRAAGCMYCTAHTCTFALRRGANASALLGSGSPRERAVAAVADAIAQVPPTLTHEQCKSLEEHFSPAEIEWIVLAAAMMGFLNKFMDSMGIELEAPVIANVASLISPTGWSVGKHGGADLPMAADGSILSESPPVDHLGMYWRVIKQAPAAIRLENTWTTGVPNRWPEVGDYLATTTGHSFPLLEKLTHKRVIRTLATILRDNLDTQTSEIGLYVKSLTGLAYATVIGNETLAREARLLAGHANPDLDESTCKAVSRIAAELVSGELASAKETLNELTADPSLTQQDGAAIVLAIAASPSPAQIDETILTHIAPLLSASAIIEVNVWLSIQQLLDRLQTFYTVTAPA